MVAGGTRVTAGASGITWAESRLPEDSVTGAVRCGETRWLFLVNEHTLVATEGFTGPVVGTWVMSRPAAGLGGRTTDGVVALAPDLASLFVVSCEGGETPLRTLTPSADVEWIRSVAFAGRVGVAVVGDSTLRWSQDAGATWTTMDESTALTRLESDGDTIRAEEAGQRYQLRVENGTPTFERLGPIEDNEESALTRVAQRVALAVRRRAPWRWQHAHLQRSSQESARSFSDGSELRLLRRPLRLMRYTGEAAEARPLPTGLSSCSRSRLLSWGSGTGLFCDDAGYRLGADGAWLSLPMTGPASRVAVDATGTSWVVQGACEGPSTDRSKVCWRDVESPVARELTVPGARALQVELVAGEDVLVRVETSDGDRVRYWLGPTSSRPLTGAGETPRVPQRAADGQVWVLGDRPSHGGPHTLWLIEPDSADTLVELPEGAHTGAVLGRELLIALGEVPARLSRDRGRTWQPLPGAAVTLRHTVASVACVATGCRVGRDGWVGEVLEGFSGSLVAGIRDAEPTVPERQLLRCTREALDEESGPWADAPLGVSGETRAWLEPDGTGQVAIAWQTRGGRVQRTLGSAAVPTTTSEGSPIYDFRLVYASPSAVVISLCLDGLCERYANLMGRANGPVRALPQRPIAGAERPDGGFYLMSVETPGTYHLSQHTADGAEVDRRTLVDGPQMTVTLGRVGRQAALVFGAPRLGRVLIRPLDGSAARAYTTRGLEPCQRAQTGGFLDTTVQVMGDLGSQSSLYRLLQVEHEGACVAGFDGFYGPASAGATPLLYVRDGTLSGRWTSSLGSQSVRCSVH
jgi:hypothetical protein